MLSRAEIDRWLTLAGPNDTKLKMALEMWRRRSD